MKLLRSVFSDHHVSEDGEESHNEEAEGDLGSRVSGSGVVSSDVSTSSSSRSSSGTSSASSWAGKISLAVSAGSILEDFSVNA